MEQALRTAMSQNNLAIWAERARVCRSSGLPVKSWCAENGIVPNTYFRWQKKVFNASVFLPPLINLSGLFAG